MTIHSSSTQKCWFITYNNDLVLITQNNTLPDEADIFQLLTLFARNFYLGLVAGIEYHCAELDATTLIPEQFKAIPLKQALALLYPQEYSIGVRAHSIIRWDKNHQFCGRCGTKTFHNSKQFERICTSCSISFFPRISPSIIVLIRKDDHVLMARSPHYPPGAYGLIAGFVEAGETIEETVHREVKEEVNLQIKNISYFGSQPWPFPDSLMLAFTAEYESGDLIIDNDEIEEAGWYRYDKLPGHPSTQMSIASKLLDYFVKICCARTQERSPSTRG